MVTSCNLRKKLPTIHQSKTSLHGRNSIEFRRCFWIFLSSQVASLSIVHCPVREVKGRALTRYSAKIASPSFTESVRLAI